VDLVYEEDVALVEGSQDGGQIPCPLDGGTAGVPDVGAELVAMMVASVVLPRPGGP